MTKIVLKNVAGTYDVTNINDNFNAIADALENKVLYRDNPQGNPNTVKNDLDMNGKRILNLPAPVSANEPARKADLLPIESVAQAVVDAGAAADRAEAVANTLQSKKETVSILDYGAKADGVTDIRAALEQALASGKPVFIPDGSYFLSAPITPVEGMAILGHSEIPVMRTRGAKIYAPNGFLSHTGARIRYQLFGIHLHGNSTPGVHCIAGKMGGLIEGNCFEKFDCAVLNQQSYLTDYRRNKFFTCNRGLWLGETNTVTVDTNHFDGDVLIQVDNQTLTPGGALVGGTGLNILANNFNVVAATQAVAKLTQTVKFTDSNYIEVYEMMPTGVALIDYLADRFGYSNFELSGNVINGQNKCERALRIRSTHTQGTDQGGSVEGNWMRGFLMRPILIDNSEGKGRVTGIRFVGNSSTQAQSVEFGASAVPYEQAIRATYTEGTLNIAGTAFVMTPLTDALPLQGADFTALGGAGWKVGTPGLYTITMSGNAKSTTADLLSLEAALQINGVTTDQRFFPIIRNAQTGNRYGNVTISGVFSLNAGDVVAMGFRNGEVLHRATLSAFRIGDNCYYKV